ncbi:MAG: UDP-N-acetylmuramate--L-alanine ligase, partial [Simkaniaceae bacterium]|nr:UDP-N-acetylmuramate--L-alanine ligase [Simkaniaceae bacterium]
AGTHGKTSTSGMLAWVLKEAGIDPSFALGGLICQLNQNGSSGSSDFFVAEADESDGSFLHYSPYGAILTGVEVDHLDYWKSEKEMQKGYEKFLSNVQKEKLLFWCNDDPYLHALNPPGISYGKAPNSSLLITEIYENTNNVVFNITFEGHTYKQIECPIIGKHQALNAAAVFGTALKIGVSSEVIYLALKSFPGMKRRSELIGKVNQITFYDDYAHHPTEILTTMRAFRKKAEKNRLIAVFQPHKYSRTRDFMAEMGSSFNDSDELIITDIYPSGEKPIPGISAIALLEKIKESGHKRARFIEQEKLLDFLKEFLCPDDIMITLGAGNITEIGRTLIKSL